MSRIKKAVILAAGGGLRLRPMTDNIPKCLVRVNGKAILSNALEALRDAGIEESILVVGYKSGQIREAAGSASGSMNITYVENGIYDKTNNIYSLYLAREHLREGAVLLEGDIFFENGILKRLLAEDAGRTCWVADKFTPDLDGCMLTADKNGMIADIRIVREKLGEYRDNFFKSVGMLKITAVFGEKFAKWLEEETANGVNNIYYDLVLAKHVKDEPLYVCDISGSKWAEIDNQEDLRLAEKKFESMI